MTERQQIILRMEKAVSQVVEAAGALIAVQIGAALRNGESLRPDSAAEKERLLNDLKAAFEQRRNVAPETVPRARADGDRLIKKRDAALILGISRSTLWRLEKDKILQPVRGWAGHGVYRESQLAAYMASLPPAWPDSSRIAAAITSPKPGRRGRPARILQANNE